MVVLARVNVNVGIAIDFALEYVVGM